MKREAILEDHRLELQHVGNNVFRMRRRESGEIYYIMNEGPISQRLGITTEKVFGKTIVDLVGEEAASEVIPYFERAFSGEVTSYELALGDAIFQTVLSPVEKDGEIIEVAGSSFDITDQKRAEKARREADERFRIAQDMSPDGFTILRPVREESGQIVDFSWVYENAAVARLNGTDPEAVEGQRLLDLFPGHRGTTFFNAYQRVAESGEPTTFEDRYQGESIPEPTWFRIVVVPMGGDIAILSRNITERKRAEEGLLAANQELRAKEQQLSASNQQLQATGERLQELEARSRALVDHSPVCHKIIDLDFNLQYMSSNGFRMLKLEETDQRYGEPYPFDFFPESARKALTDGLSKVKASGEAATFESHTCDVEENPVWLHHSLIPVLNESGAISFITVVSADITERKIADAELEASRDRLRQLTTRLDAVREEERTVLARELHDDVGQNLTALRMDLRGIEREIPEEMKHLTDRLRSMISLTQDSVDRLNRLSSDLRSPILDMLGLGDAVESEVWDFKERWNTEVDLEMDLGGIEVFRTPTSRSTASSRSPWPT
jgi:PAS domain-containing protein